MFALMNRYTKCFLIFIFLWLFLFAFIKPIVAEESNVVVEFFYSSGYCEQCEEKKPIVNDIEEYFEENITVEQYPVDIDEYVENYNKFRRYGFTTWPAVVVKNTSAEDFDLLFEYEEITFDNLKNGIDYHIKGNYSEKPPEITDNKVETIFGLLNLSELSLPIITIVLAVADSFNPCSFFIFLVLISILFHMQSRKRMLLVAGIFIFFSGFFYFLLMTAIFNLILILENQIIITLIAGLIALGIGTLNIKDFFIFKKGPSLSIPEEKKSYLFKQIRRIAKMPYLYGLIIYTIILAFTVNTIELLCTLGLPLVYTKILTTYNLSLAQYYLYLIIYNVIYVIPLFVIVVIFIVILKRWKLSEWQGRLLKLYSGVMMLSLGFVLIINPTVLHHIFAAIGLLLISLFVALLISIIWKKKFPPNTNPSK
jgi:hypothetical protein